MKLDRLLGILTVLLQTDRITAPELADRFEVSRRTISRDVDALCRAGIPVVTRQGGSGGISIAEGYKLDKSVLTADELSSMVAALKGLGSVSEQSRMEGILDKLSSSGEAVVSLRESIVIDLAAQYRPSLTDKIRRIQDAIQGNRLVEFIYYYEKGESRRTVEPCFVSFQWGAWYLFGYCTLRQDFRLFKLGRLWDLTIGEESFTPRDIPPEKRDFNARFTDEIWLSARFHPSVKYRLIDAYGPDCFTEQEDGFLLVEMGFTNRSYLMEWLLGFGDKVQVHSPQDVASELRAIGKNMAELYQ